MNKTVIILCALFAVASACVLVRTARALAGSAAELSAQPGVKVASESPAELPAEWRWTRKPVRFDHMYMGRDRGAHRPDLGRR
ncbi:MAG: hypothetical protein OEZ06_31310 [Myxococcales bacterium]|nr:hypothetical protein [Myxococcales bacterium]